MNQAEPKVGQLYSCAEQSRMHGGDQRSTLPDSEGRVTLIRFRLDRNRRRACRIRNYRYSRIHLDACWSQNTPGAQRSTESCGGSLSQRAGRALPR